MGRRPRHAGGHDQSFTVEIGPISSVVLDLRPRELRQTIELPCRFRGGGSRVLKTNFRPDLEDLRASRISA